MLDGELGGSGGGRRSRCRKERGRGETQHQ